MNEVFRIAFFGINLVQGLQWLSFSSPLNRVWRPDDCNNEVFKGNIISGDQLEFCLRNLHLMAIIVQGNHITRQHCKEQFKTMRWDCARIDQIANSYIPKELLEDTPEAAYIYALSAAAVAYRYTERCFTNKGCSCGRRGSVWNHMYPKERIKFHPCTNYIEKGVEFSKEFTETIYETEFVSDKKLQTNRIKLHNSKMGREAFQKSGIIKCQCIGPSTTCASSICHRVVPLFKVTAREVYARYTKAIEIGNKLNKNEQRSRSMTKLVTIHQSEIYKDSKRTNVRDTSLQFGRASPNYCDVNYEYGLIGTKGRHCVLNSTDTDSCQHLCCGRGFHVKSYKITDSCNCRFVYCCRVQCTKCIKQRVDYICK